MPFNARKLEAELALRRILPEHLPDAACDALEAGFDGPGVRRMASLIRPTGWETDEALPAFRKDLGINTLSTKEASVRLAYDRALDLIGSEADPLPSLPFFARLCSQAEYPEQLMDLHMLDDEWYCSSSIYGRTAQQVTATTRDALLKLIRNFETTHMIA